MIWLLEKGFIYNFFEKLLLWMLIVKEKLIRVRNNKNVIFFFGKFVLLDVIFKIVGM